MKTNAKDTESVRIFNQKQTMSTNSIFISNADVYEFEFTGDLDAVKESAMHRTTGQDIALHLAGSEYKMAIQCGGGYQVFQSVREAKDWENDNF